MKKIIAIASAPVLALSLAACGGSADEADENESLDEAVEEVAAASNAGTYTSTSEDGAEIVVSLDAEGGYSITSNGEAVESGSWEENDNGTCMTAEGGDGEDCFSIVPGEDAGMMDVTGPDGETSSYSYES